MNLKKVLAVHKLERKGGKALMARLPLRNRIYMVLNVSRSESRTLIFIQSEWAVFCPSFCIGSTEGVKNGEKQKLSFRLGDDHYLRTRRTLFTVL